MFKNKFLNTASFLFDSNNDSGATDAEEKAKLRASLTKNVTVTNKSSKETEVAEPEAEEETEENESEEETEKETEEELAEDDTEKVKETEEEKAAREKQEKEAAKLKRKDERMQRRIDTAIAEKKAAEAEVTRLKAQLEANPEKKLTEAEVEALADAKAEKKVQEKEIERLQKEFNDSCDKLQAEANKIDKEFTSKVVDMAQELGPIPSRVIGILSDLGDNYEIKNIGAEVLNFMVNDIDEAEKIYNLKDKPEKLAIALVRIADKLAEEKKPKPKQVSKVPNPVIPVKTGRVQSTQITEADTKNMDSYIRKRIAMKEAKKKARGY